MSQSWQPGWKVLNCLTNTTKILGRKIKHGKLGFLFQGLAFRPLDQTLLEQFLQLSKRRTLLQQNTTRDMQDAIYLYLAKCLHMFMSNSPTHIFHTGTFSQIHFSLHRGNSPYKCQHCITLRDVPFFLTMLTVWVPGVEAAPSSISPRHTEQYCLHPKKEQFQAIHKPDRHFYISQTRFIF